MRAPSEAAKSRLQSGVAQQVGEALAQVLGEADGRERTLKAWGASLLRDVPMGAAQLAVFETLCVGSSHHWLVRRWQWSG